jgi:hypothetical protein
MSWFSDFVDSVREAFSGGSSNSSQSDSGSGNDRTPPRTRPQQRPSIMTVQRQPEDDRQLVATRDMPRFGISEGQSESEPDYSPFSIQGLTSTDPGNVMRNIQGAERMARAMPADSGRDDSPAPVQAAAPASAAAPAQAASAATELTSVADQEAQIEEAGETAAARARRLGLASTIATSPGGLLAGGEGTTRRRRSLMGGGLIA